MARSSSPRTQSSSSAMKRRVAAAIVGALALTSAVVATADPNGRRWDDPDGVTARGAAPPGIAGTRTA